MLDFSLPTSRRAALRTAGAAMTIAAIGNASAASGPDGGARSARSAIPPAARSLSALTDRLAAIPRRRRFTAVPFLVDNRDLWDYEAAAELLAYNGGPRQVWENSDIAAAWLGLMREATNGQVFAHGHPDFLAVSATHGTAHLALFSQEMWDKYDLASHTGGAATSNRFILEKAGASPADDRHDINGFYGISNNSITALQQRGAVFVGCHDSIHAIARGLHKPDTDVSADLIAADLTNNLIPGVVLVPSVVAFLVELQRVNYTYAKGS
jgi:intracellular sulfur oxidation DsrE/DsrF family protein